MFPFPPLQGRNGKAKEQLYYRTKDKSAGELFCKLTFYHRDGNLRPLLRANTAPPSRKLLPSLTGQQIGMGTAQLCQQPRAKARKNPNGRCPAPRATRLGDDSSPPSTANRTPRTRRCRASLAHPLRARSPPLRRRGARPSAPHGGAAAAGLLRGASAPCGPHGRGGGGGGGRRQAHVAMAGPRRRGGKGEAGRRRRRAEGRGGRGGGGKIK